MTVYRTIGFKHILYSNVKQEVLGCDAHLQKAGNNYTVNRKAKHRLWQSRDKIQNKNSALLYTICVVLFRSISHTPRVLCPQNIRGKH